jgi:alkanesulfonate monooxygenase SsuD/methylene tetrahydromethanopterin reductase-like flavin-dependent oxidoreductase (luciferase family)
MPTPVGGGEPGPSTLADNARLLERLGYRSLWVFDAVGRGFLLPDPLMALTVAATVTGPRVELGTGVLQLPIRNPAEVAHRALTLHLLAGDRLLLGVGPGSTATDFATFSGPDGLEAAFDQRFERFDRQLAELRDWLGTGAHGDHRLGPEPVGVGGPKLLLAGWRGRWVERAAVESDGWIASGTYADDDTLADAIGRFRRSGGTRAIVTNLRVEADPGPMIERLGRLAEMGFDDAVVVDPTPSEERFSRLRREAPAE